MSQNGKMVANIGSPAMMKNYYEDSSFSLSNYPSIKKLQSCTEHCGKAVHGIHVIVNTFIFNSG